MSEFTNVYLENVQKSMDGVDVPNLVSIKYIFSFQRSNSNRQNHINPAILLQSQIVSEIHSIVSAIKPLITWTCRDAIKECREACGGHGFHVCKFILLSIEVISIIRNHFQLRDVHLKELCIYF